MSDESAQDDVQRVREASDIVRVVGEHIELKARGREYVGLCPFHDDTKPSMYVVPAKQMYHCFSCGAGGDIFTFVQDYHSMTFREALKYLAERAGISLQSRGRRRTASDSALSVSRSVLLEANEVAQKFYRSIYRHAEHGKAARELVEQRGISPEMVEAFGIGAAPQRWDGLVVFLSSKQRTLEPYLQAGLIKARDHSTEGGFFDALRHRLVFPIRDQIGRVIAFGGRRINDEDEPKYLNSPESPVFDKSATLFGLDLASRSIQREGVAIIAEGYTDVIACHQAGITNVVATLGTALTPKHATLLRRLCHTVVLLFDGDQAGQRAADRAAEVFLTLPIDAKIATLAGFTDAKDPDELLKRPGGSETLKSAIDGATELLEYRIARLRDRLASAGAAEMERALRDEFRTLGSLGLASADKIRWQFVIRRLSELSGLNAASIADLVREGAGRARFNPRADDQPRPKPADCPAGPAEVLGCLLAAPTLWLGLEDHQRAVLEQACTGSPLHPVFEAMHAAEQATGRTELQTVIDELRRRGSDHRLAVELERDITRRLGDDPEQIGPTLKQCLAELGRSVQTIESKPKASAAERIEQIRASKVSGGTNTRLYPRPPGVLKTDDESSV